MLLRILYEIILNWQCLDFYGKSSTIISSLFAQQFNQISQVNTYIFNKIAEESIFHNYNTFHLV